MVLSNRIESGASGFVAATVLAAARGNGQLRASRMTVAAGNPPAPHHCDHGA